MAEGRKAAEFDIHISNSNFENLIIGNGNTINISCGRRLQYVERSPTHRSSASSSGQMTAIQDGGEWRGTKRKQQSKIKFPQRKFRPDPKKLSSESDEDIPRLSSLVNFPTISEDNERKIVKSLNEFFYILGQLHPLRDSGNWKQFDITAETLLQSKRDPELNILIALEKSVVISYQNDLERSEAMVLEALKMLQKSKVIDQNNYHFLVSMAHCHLTGFYRRQNKHGKAEESIGIAEQNSQNTKSRFLKALIYYEMASNLTKYISSIPAGKAREELVSRAKHFMKQCIALCIELDGGHVYIRKHHFGLLKLALMELNCRTRAARSQNTSSRCIEEAKNCLKTVEENYEAQMSEGQRIQFFVAKSDLSFRLNNLEDAEVNANRALFLAETNGFSLEISGIKERLENISSLIRSRETMTVEMPLSRAEHPETLSSSPSPSKKNSPTSSGCEMEVTVS